MTLQRIRWNKVKLNYSLDEIADILFRNGYDTLKGYGFVDVHKKENTVFTVYSELNKRIVEIEDPFGNIISDEIDDYSYINFSLKKIDGNKYLMTIVNPSKSLKMFINNISEVFDYSLSVSSLNIDLIDYIHVVKNSDFVNDFSICKLKASSIVVNENSKAILELTSKHNALKDIVNILGDKDYILERIKAKTSINNAKINFELSKSGSFSVDEEYVSFFTDVIVQYLEFENKKRCNID